MLELIPDHLNDLNQLLTHDGFQVSNVWYHGTASGLLPSIQENGLQGGGDRALIERTQQTLGTIGGRTFDSQEPVFLTQSKALAYYWAIKKVHTRNLYFQQDESPVVLTITPDANAIKPDVGAAAILMEPNNEYITLLKDVYQQQTLDFSELDPRTADRQEYITRLAMAYTLETIVPAQIGEVITA